MGRTVSQEKQPKIANIGEYIRLKNVRAETGLIAGRIFYKGRFYTEAEYARKFPEPKLVYDVENPDKKHIEK